MKAEIQSIYRTKDKRKKEGQSYHIGLWRPGALHAPAGFAQPLLFARGVSSSTSKANEFQGLITPLSYARRVADRCFTHSHSRFLVSHTWLQDGFVGGLSRALCIRKVKKDGECVGPAREEEVRLWRDLIEFWVYGVCFSSDC